jgi:hypothetical protein
MPAASPATPTVITVGRGSEAPRTPTDRPPDGEFDVDASAQLARLGQLVSEGERGHAGPGRLSAVGGFGQDGAMLTAHGVPFAFRPPEAWRLDGDRRLVADSPLTRDPSKPRPAPIAGAEPNPITASKLRAVW